MRSQAKAWERGLSVVSRAEINHVQFALTTILMAPRFGWQPPPDRSTRLRIYAQARELEFEGIEWSPRWLDYDQMHAGELCALKQEVLDHDLTICGLNLNRFLLTRCPQAGRHFERLMDSLRVAGEWEAECVTVSLSMPEPPAPDRPLVRGQSFTEEEFDRTAELLREAAGAAEANGVRLVLELHDDGLLDSPERCLRMRDAIGRANIGINPDLGNLVRHTQSRESWRTALQQLAPEAGFWHVKNYRDGRPASLWDGDIDYTEAFSIMRRAGYNGWVTIESYSDGDVLRTQRQCLQWLRNLEANTVL